MSFLKYQLRNLLPSLSEQAKSCQDRKIKQRLYLIKAIASSQRSIAGACQFRGLCRDSFYRWVERLLDQRKLEALGDLSRKPKRSPNQTSPRIERKIRVIKKREPYLGPERISHLLEDHSMQCPPSTVYSVLKRNKLISKEYRKQRTKKHIKRYREPVPGFFQMDFKYAPFLIGNIQYYQLSAIDHCSSWRLIRSYTNKGEAEVLEFLQELKRECPFPIFQIQTDNDAAFTDKYTVGLGLKPTGAHPMDQWCKKHGIRHKLIPIGEKELNGKVENSHKFDDEEFYSQEKINSFTELSTKTYIYNHRWNDERATKTLGWKTPNEVILPYVTTLAILEGYFRVLLEESLQPLEAETPERLQPEVPIYPVIAQIKPQKIDPLDRYFAWMDWEAAQYPKTALLPLSYMSISYS